MPEEQGLSVRQAKRHDLAFDADMWIAPEDAGRVRISSSAGARGDKLRVTVVDASSGGIGIVSPVYIPRRCGVIVRVLNPQDASRTPLLETKLLVQRTRMTDRRPAYLLGASFAPLGGAEVAGVARFLALLDDQSVEGASPAPGNGTEAPRHA